MSPILRRALALILLGLAVTHPEAVASVLISSTRTYAVAVGDLGSGSVTGTIDLPFGWVPQGLWRGTSGPIFLAVRAGGGNQGVYVLDLSAAAILPLAIGAPFLNPGDLAVAPDGSPIVVDGDRLIRVDRATHVASIVTSSGFLRLTHGLDIDASGIAFVSDIPGGGGIGLPRVVRIDLATGAQSLVSEDAALAKPYGVRLDAGGHLWIADQSPLNQGRMLRMRISDGVVDLVLSGALLRRPIDVTLDDFGSLLVLDEWGPGGSGSVNRMDQTTGAQTVLLEPPGFDIPNYLLTVPDPPTPTRSSTWSRIKLLYR
jgi:hypothetical protein